MMSATNPKHGPIIFVGQIPPPYNGQTVMIRVLLEGIQQVSEVHYVRMDYSASIDEVGRFRFKKIGVLFALIRDSLKELKQHEGAILYYPPASANCVPVLRDIIYLLCVRKHAGAVVYHHHAFGLADFFCTRPLLSRIARIAYGRADVAVVPTAGCLQDPQFLGAKRITVIPSGRNISVCRKDFRPSLDERDGLRILFVGIHTREKGLFDLVETVRNLVERGVEVVVHCVGEWKSFCEKETVDSLLIEYGLLDVITFCGRCIGDDLWEQYRWANVFFFPTQYRMETQGMVVVEAMAFGLPVVASRWRGPKDVVIDGETGILCEPGSVAEYTDALLKLNNDSEARKRMGAAGRECYLHRYTEEAYIEQWTQLFKSLS